MRHHRRQHWSRTCAATFLSFCSWASLLRLHYRALPLGREVSAIPAVESERGRALGGDSEGALEGDACAAEGAFLKETADERDAVGNAARLRKIMQRIFQIGLPV